MNSPIQQQFLKEGWTQVQSVFDENIPVFFKYDPRFESYPFRVIFTVMHIGKLFNINHRTISLIFKNKIWKQVRA